MKNLKIFKSGFYEKLKLLIIPMMLITLGVGQIWAADIEKNARIYFDNSTSNWSYSYNYFVINDANGYKMTAIDRSKLYYHKRSADTWSGYSGIRLVAFSSDWGTNDVNMKNYQNMYDYCSNMSNWYSASHGFGSTGYHFISLNKAGSKTSQATVSITYHGSKPTKTSTAKIRTRTNYDGSYSTVSSGTWPATVNMKGTHWDGDGASASNTVATSSGSSGTYTNMYTGLVEMSVASLSEQYTFDGWATSAAASPSNTNATYSYYITSDATVYAYFTKKWTITFDKNGHGDESTPSTQYVAEGGKVSAVSDLSEAGYSFGGWYTNSSCTGSAWNFASNTVSEDITLYAKWTPIPGVSLTASKTTGINVGETITLTATGVNASNITQYEFFEGSSSLGTVSAPTNTFSYTPTTVGNKTMHVVMTYNSGSNTVTSSDLALTLNTPSVSLAVKAGSSSSFHLGEGSTILKATPSNVGAGVTPSYVFTDQIAGGNGVTSASQTGTEWTYNPSATGQAKTRTMKVTMSVGGSTYTGTVSVTVYEKFTVHIKNTDSWSAMYLYMWNGSGNAGAWPGTQQTAYNGSSKWYNVVLDTEYTSFIISQGNDTKKSGTISMLAASNAGNCYTTTTGTSLPSTTCPSAPSVSTNTASSIGFTSMTLRANSVSDNSDDITSYGFKYGTTEACSGGTVTASNLSSGSFSKSISGLNVGTTYYFKAYATNAQGTTYGSVRSAATTTATLSLEGAADYEAKTMTITPTTNMTSVTYYVCCTCTSKPGGADDPTITWNGSTKKLEISDIDTDGDYTFNVKLKPNSDCSGSAFNNANANVTITMRTIPDRSGLTIGHARYNTSYMGGDGASATPYFIYTSRAATYGKLDLSATLPDDLLTGETLYYSVNGSEIGTVTVDGTAASVTMDLPNKTVGADQTAAIKIYSKLDGQTAPSAKMASATVYYTVSANPVVTISATCDDVPVVGDIPQNATIVVSASATNIPGEPTFVFKKGSGEYSSTTSYTIPEASTTMYAKTTYLGDDWTASMGITTYATNSVTYVLSMTDLYGDDASTTTSRLFKSGGEEHTAPTIDGYTFTGWTCTTSNVEVSDDSGVNWKSSSSNATVYVRATAAGGTLTATYTANNRIYFDDTNTGWGSVTVYLFSDKVWHSDMGVQPKENRIEYSTMTRIGESKVYYYEYECSSSDIKYVAFSKANQNTYDYLYATRGAYRGDFDDCTPVYVSNGEENDSKNSTRYFSSGYWRRYMPQTAPYSIALVSPSSVNKGKFEIEHKGVDEENFVKEVELLGSTNYEFNLPSSCGGTYGNTGTMTKDSHTNWTFTKGTGNCHITTTAAGIYKFHLSTADGKVKLTVDYPLSQGDYQVYYTDNTYCNNNYSNYIRQNTSGSAKKDTVSFFVKKNASPTFQIKRCTGFTGSTPNWEDVGSETVISVDRDSVYNLIFEQNGSGTTISKVGQEYYSGNYYIRTDGAAGGWMNYLSNPDNKMKHTDKASALAAGYNYYYMRYIGDASGNSTANVKFCIATDYNDCVSQEHGNDPSGGSLYPGQALTGKGANVRFTYHPGTNVTTRTCIGGSTHDDQYLVINGTNLQTSGGASWTGRTKMNDLNDWIYTFELKASDDATITLESHYNNRYVTVLPSKKVLEGGDGYYDLNIIYDYKTNEVVAAYIPSTVSTELSIDVDIMFIRQAKDNKPDEDAPTTTLTLSGDGKITGDPKTLYGAIKFEKDYVRAEGSFAGLASNRPERSTYWISFPFDVRVSDIFGLGDYTETWILQRYRGDLRASRGWFLETSSFWEYIFDTDYVLEAGQGYVLSIDCEAIQWPHSQTEQYLYFPSKDQVSTISQVLPKASMDVPEHECTITSPADRTVKDSHWNVIGIPGFADAWGNATEDVEVVGGDLHYFYAWDAATNTLSSESTQKYNFKFMHSYMVQYHGNIDWTASEPDAVPARRASNAKPEEVEFRLNLMQGEQEADHTFITLMDKEQITTGFDMNTDLVKMFNANKSNIYTVINTDVQAAANCLPMTEQTTLVPVGVQVKTDGEYTFAIPEGTNGVGVTLIDNIMNTRTNLGLMDYTVNLTAGTIDGRFMLEISPISQNPTDIDQLPMTNDQSSVKKVLIDGLLYIVKGDRIYDATGALVK